MKVNKALLIVVFLVTLFLGFLLGLYIRGLQSDERVIDLNPFAKSCQYWGKTYKSGESFPAGDGCNSCGCTDGRVGCTLMACE